MDVPGRKFLGEKGSEEFVDKPCKPCEDEGKYTAANGLCQECEENMCSTCFRHHKKGKFCKDHVLLDHRYSGSIPKEIIASDEGLGKCQQHLKELIKFYCPTHEQVGCGDCIILEHKTCKVEYIPDKATVFKDSRDFETVVNNVKSCSNQSQECLSAIQTNRNVVEAVHAKFIVDAEAFRDEIVNHVYNLTSNICDQATDIKSKTIDIFGILEKDAFDISHEISSIEETLLSQQDQPNKLFVTSVQIKQKLESLKEKLDESKKKNKTTEYIFQRDEQLKSALMQCDGLGVIQRCSGKEDEIDAKLENMLLTSEKEVKQATVNIPKVQPLLDRKLRIDNIHADGDHLSFIRGNPLGNVNGVYIGDIKMTNGCHFEVEIINSGGMDGSIGIGIVPEDYPKNAFPGWRQCSAGYHSDDGRSEKGYYVRGKRSTRQLLWIRMDRK
ncbi:tripartite motif-containing protein 45-like isoform X2 [Mercenaria mercenaria]|uniref:tripartite motif-containing protein 45-like isoform X2 n=1 Tax=Mercenaria mercenaria TaxID=6596 RepID=UPI00234E727F|nr:tripartite motif-containing protein 45-like isoform X2 [Mercenaria mercenaria]